MEDVVTTRFPHHPDNVPAELKVGDVWVTCDEYKVPLIALPSGVCFAASSTNADTWRSYETALAAYSENEHISGIGRVICEDEDYVGVDIDDCLDPDTGEISDGASAILTRLASYAEISPSLAGIKIWVRAPGMKTAYKKPRLEIYPARRYFTVTGLPLNEHKAPIAVRGDELAAIIEEEFPKVDRDRSPYDGPTRVLDLDGFLDRARVVIFSVLTDGAAERKYRIRCPWIEEHTDEDESGTYVGQYPDGALFFACWHSHCAHRRWREFRALLNPLVYLGRPSRSKACRREGRLR
jgi:hypothetical protein